MRTKAKQRKRVRPAFQKVAEVWGNPRKFGCFFVCGKLVLQQNKKPCVNNKQAAPVEVATSAAEKEHVPWQKSK